MDDDLKTRLDAIADTVNRFKERSGTTARGGGSVSFFERSANRDH